MKKIILFLFLSFFIFSCQNSNNNLKGSSSSKLSKDELFGEGDHLNVVSSLEYKISSASFNDIEDTVNLTVVPSASSTVSFEQKGFCSTGSNSQSTGCICKYEWTERVQNKNYKRVAQTSVLSAVHAQVVCEKPIPLLNKKIADGTTLFISVHSSSSNPQNFFLDPIGAKVGDTALQLCNGKFCLNNIARYTCHEKVKRGRYINNWLNRYDYNVPVNGATNVQRLYQPSGTRFCFQDYKTNVLTSDTTDNPPPSQGECAELPASKKEKTTAIQNFYYSLYIREDDIHNIVKNNDFYQCPLVEQSESLRKTANDHWPLDTTFSLSQHKTGDFNVPIIASSQLGLNSVNIQSHTQCGDDSKNSKKSGNYTPSTAIASHCLGWAMKPLHDGTCPLYSDEKGITKQTFRLRRFAAAYPHTYNTNGAVFPQAPAVDVVYVVDRPVKNTDYPAKSDIQYYSMKGPKPCPFAYQDWLGVDTAKTTGYFSTNDPRWEGINVEGIHLPNLDNIGTPINQRSCAATLPVVGFDHFGNIKGLSLSTSFSGNKKSIKLIEDGSASGSTPSSLAVSLEKTYLRPGSPWSPHYVEDTKFEACAVLPEGTEYKDAPLHVTNAGDGNFAWCSAVYPTKNSNVTSGSLNQMQTSASIKGQKLPTSNYDCSGSTCNRSTVASGSETRFPLQAKAADTERMLAQDSSYRCEITYDQFKDKSHQKQSPFTGCCASNVLDIFLTKGASAYLPPLKSGIMPQSFGPGCGTPSY